MAFAWAKAERATEYKFEYPHRALLRSILQGQNKISNYSESNYMKKPEYMIKNSQFLRKNMTKEEMHLWLDFLQGRPYSVRRQKVIEKYILDFYIPSAKMAIEIDGRQHGKEENKESDRERDAFLKGKGIQVLRYTNAQINENFAAVCKDIQKQYDNKKLRSTPECQPKDLF